jgi:hypothetical protein
MVDGVVVFVGVALAIAVHGRDLVWRNGGAPLTGPVSVIAEEAATNFVSTGERSDVLRRRFHGPAGLVHQLHPETLA